GCSSVYFYKRLFTFAFGSLRLLDILTARLRLSSGRLGPFWDIPTRRRFEHIAFLMHRLGSQFLDQILRLCCIADKAATFDVSIVLVDQPFDRCPRSGFTLASHPLQMTGITDILGAVGHEILIRADLHMIVITLSSTAGFCAPRARFCLALAIGIIFSTGCHGYLLS